MPTAATFTKILAPQWGLNMLNNPLQSKAAQPVAAQATAQNPLLAPTPTPASTQGMNFAQLGQHLSGVPQDKLDHATDFVSYAAQELGKLARQPNVSRADVIKAVSDAMASGKMKADEAATFLAKVPDDKTKLRPFLDELYRQNLMGAVHLKAMQFARGGAR